MIQKSIACFIAFALAVRVCVAAGPANTRNELTELSGTEARAISIALADFLRKKGTYKGGPVYGDLRHYTVELWRQPEDVLKINFIPAFGPNDRGPNGHIIGGATEFGWAVTYFVSLKKMKILRQQFAR